VKAMLGEGVGGVQRLGADGVGGLRRCGMMLSALVEATMGMLEVSTVSWLGEGGRSPCC